MFSVPNLVRISIVAYWDVVLSWINTVIYADLIQHAANHCLAALQTTLGVTPLETTCAPFHHAMGPARRPPIPCRS